MYEDVVNEKKCRLTADMLKQLKSGDGSEWLIDNNDNGGFPRSGVHQQVFRSKRHPQRNEKRCCFHVS